MKSIFGAKGMLKVHLPGFEMREGQLAMAEDVAGALENDRVLFYEAPTGTGKTLAYLIPCILSRRKVVISTDTKALQEQIIRKDLPLAMDVIGEPVKFAVMKGRQNYLCKSRLDIFLKQPMFSSMSEQGYFTRILDWARETQNGDREELTDLPDEFNAWNEFNSNANICGGQKCANHGSCFFYKMRRKAAEADLIVVNHHLFFADLALRAAGVADAEVIPRYTAVILDEAHQIEEVATQFFGLQMSNYRIEEIARDTVRVVTALKILDDKVTSRVNGLRNASDNFFAKFHTGYEDKFRILPTHLNDTVLEAQTRLTQSMESLAEALADVRPKEDGDQIQLLEDRLDVLAAELAAVLDMKDETRVNWCEVRRGGVFLNASPIELEGDIGHTIFSAAPTMILCSATLSTDNNFEFLKSRIGYFGTAPDLNKLAVEAIGPPCFDYKTQSLLYIPHTFPEPNHPEFVDALAESYLRILAASKGRAFCLFTSYKNLNAVHERIADQLPYTILLQGTGAKSALLEQFRADEHSVLFATSSFWGGVDVVGRSLSVVLIDKLPFASPGEPLIEARIEALKKKRGNPFMNYQLPQAVITLKQGLGRLIRHRGDKGLLGVFDIRMRTKHYGRRILKGIPDFPVNGDIDRVCESIQRLVQETIDAEKKGE